jgi:hypothetical protein
MGEQDRLLGEERFVLHQVLRERVFGITVKVNVGNTIHHGKSSCFGR